MKKAVLIEEFNTSLGKTLILKKIDLNIGEKFDVNGNQYTVKRIIMQSRPLKEECISVIV